MNSRVGLVLWSLLLVILVVCMGVVGTVRLLFFNESDSIASVLDSMAGIVRNI